MQSNVENIKDLSNHLKEARMAAKLLKKRFNIQNVNDWLAENDKNMDGKLKLIFSYLISIFAWL